MKKIIKSVLLVFFSAILVFVISCGGNGDGKIETASDNVDSSQSQTDAAENTETPEEARIEPNLPIAEDIDFGGYKFTFLSFGRTGVSWAYEYPHDILTEEETNPTINDAVYKRNDVITDRYNFEIELITNSVYVSMLRKAVNSNMDIYDAVLVFNNDINVIVPGNMLVQTHELPYVDENMPWWDPAVRALSICGVNCLLGGDLLTYDDDAVEALIFNKKMIDKYNLDSPYDHVYAGTWTFDVFYGMVKQVYEDLDGDGAITPKQDRFGFLMFNDTLPALLVSGGGSLALKDENDIPYMTVTNERNLKVIEKAMDIMFHKPNVLNGQEKGLNPMYEWFAEGKSLFQWVRMYELEKLRGMEDPFGVVPLPKFDEEQDQYYSPVNPYTGVLIGVPHTAEDLERTSIILEALSAESRYTLKPAYYDVALTRKYTRDNESNDMLDIIFGSRVYDIGTIYSFNNLLENILGLAKGENRNVISLYAKQEVRIQTAIDRLVQVFESRQ